ncbi:hypothetical protein TrVE_jg2046 [Triparma verrucosa]|uniref:Kinesin motor domain-containing protein n=1 Tax=Triparma verrucosa TaxID=1606542 RepID=A0A9W7BNK4_9STRA|nr:hypothetical protein TrVE_jg2046 [Triparma verrucosa]
MGQPSETAAPLRDSRRQSAPAAYARPPPLDQPEPQGPTESSCSIQVFCRFRPTKEQLKSSSKDYSATKDCPFGIDEEAGVIKADIDAQGTLTTEIMGGGRSFHYDRVFRPDCSQSDVYTAAESIVTGVMMGFNGTIMSYGQTSSGKTHTMEGKLMGFSEDPGDEADNELRGICPRAIDTLFKCIEEAEEDMEFTLKLSFVEIYCEKIRDLLEPMSNNLKIKEAPSGEMLLAGVTEVYVTDQDGVFGVMQQGKANRTTAATLMNAESSRSHSLLMMTVTQRNVKTERVMRAKLVLGDLAGSERIKKTRVSGVRLDEAKKINQSLSTLGMVINSLTDGSTHVPYRDSKLTRVLQESLGGNSRTALIVCCAPERIHAPETISTLRFGERASRIRNVIVRNEELSVKELQALLADANAEIDRLQQHISRLESAVNIAGKAPTSSTKTGGPNKEVLTALASMNAIKEMSSMADDELTKKLLDEVDSMGIDAEDTLLSRDSEGGAEEALKRQVDALKSELKKQRLMQIQSFKNQRKMEGELKVAQDQVATLSSSIPGADKSPVDSDAEDDNDTVTTVGENAVTIAELENVTSQLAAERDEHAQTRATCQALQDALTQMAEQHLLDEKDKKEDSNLERERTDSATMTDLVAETRSRADSEQIDTQTMTDQQTLVNSSTMTDDDDSLAEDVYERVIGNAGEVPSPLISRVSGEGLQGAEEKNEEENEEKNLDPFGLRDVDTSVASIQTEPVIVNASTASIQTEPMEEDSPPPSSTASIQTDLVVNEEPTPPPSPLPPPPPSTSASIQTDPDTDAEASAEIAVAKVAMLAAEKEAAVAKLEGEKEAAVAKFKEEKEAAVAKLKEEKEAAVAKLKEEKEAEAKLYLEKVSKMEKEISALTLERQKGEEEKRSNDENIQKHAKLNEEERQKSTDQIQQGEVEILKLRRALEETKERNASEVEALNAQIASLDSKIEEFKQAEHQNKLNVENLATQLAPEQLSNLKNLSSELQAMIDDEIEQLEQELQEAENSSAKANKDLGLVREELAKEKKVAFDTESELRKELMACRKQIESLNEREERALESVEKRRSSRGNFWSPSRRLSELSSGGTQSDLLSERTSSASMLSPVVKNLEGGADSPGMGGDTVESLRSELDLLEHQYHSNLDAHALVLETKEEVLRSLLKQNASLTMDRSSLQRERETLLNRVDELTEAVRAIQKAQALMTSAATHRLSGGGGAAKGSIRGGGRKGSGGATSSPLSTPKVIKAKKRMTMTN